MLWSAVHVSCRMNRCLGCTEEHWDAPPPSPPGPGSWLATSFHHHLSLLTLPASCLPAAAQALGQLVPRLLGATDLSHLERSLAEHLLKDHTGSHLMEVLLQVGGCAAW